MKQNREVLLWVCMLSGLGAMVFFAFRCLAGGILLALVFILTGLILMWRQKQEKRMVLQLQTASLEEFLAESFPDGSTPRRIQEKIADYLEEHSQEQVKGILEKETQISFLQSQINPHFLYNTLECIRSQALMNGDRECAQMVKVLATYFRYNINQKDPVVTIREEIENVRNYVLIQKFRFEDDLEYIVEESNEATEIMDCYIPKLTLQPIIENAIHHGLEQSMNRGTVRLRVMASNRHIFLRVSDNGVGMDDETLAKLQERIARSETVPGERDSHGIALTNVRERLRILFGEDTDLQVGSVLGEGTDVTVMLPVLREKPHFGVDAYEKGKAIS